MDTLIGRTDVTRCVATSPNGRLPEGRGGELGTQSYAATIPSKHRTRPVHVIPECVLCLRLDEGPCTNFVYPILFYATTFRRSDDMRCYTCRFGITARLTRPVSFFPCFQFCFQKTVRQFCIQDI